MFAAALVGTLVNILSPGNMERVATNLDVPPLRLAFYVVRPYDSPWAYMADARLLAMVAFLAAIPKPEAAVPWKPIAAALFAILVATIAVTFGQNMTPQERVLDFLFAVTVGAAFLLGLSLRFNIPQSVASLVLALTLVASPNVKSAFHDPQPRYVATPCPYSINR